MSERTLDIIKNNLHRNGYCNTCKEDLSNNIYGDFGGHNASHDITKTK